MKKHISEHNMSIDAQTVNFSLKNNFFNVVKKFLQKNQVFKYFEQNLPQNHQNTDENYLKMSENHEMLCFDRFRTSQ